MEERGSSVAPGGLGLGGGKQGGKGRRGQQSDQVYTQVEAPDVAGGGLGGVRGLEELGLSEVGGGTVGLGAGGGG